MDVVAKGMSPQILLMKRRTHKSHWQKVEANELKVKMKLEQSQSGIGTISRDPKDDNTKEKWLKSKDQVGRTLVKYVSKELWFHIQKQESPTNAWNILQKPFPKPNEAWCLKLEEQLMHFDPRNSTKYKITWLKSRNYNCNQRSVALTLRRIVS